MTTALWLSPPSWLSAWENGSPVHQRQHPCQPGPSVVCFVNPQIHGIYQIYCTSLKFHTWRIRAATLGCCLLTSSIQHLAHSGLECNALQLDIRLPHKLTPKNSNLQSHLLFVSTQHRSSPGLCVQPPPVHIVHPWQHSQTSSELYSEVCATITNTIDCTINNDESSYQEEINSPAEWYTENRGRGLAPSYLSDLLLPYQPARTLRSSRSGLSSIPEPRTKIHSESAFSHYDPRLWNSLPENLRSAETVDILKGKLKTHLFNQAFN